MIKKYYLPLQNFHQSPGKGCVDADTEFLDARPLGS